MPYPLPFIYSQFSFAMPVSPFQLRVSSHFYLRPTFSFLILSFSSRVFHNLNIYLCSYPFLRHLHYSFFFIHAFPTTSSFFLILNFSPHRQNNFSIKSHFPKTPQPPRCYMSCLKIFSSDFCPLGKSFSPFIVLPLKFVAKWG